MELFDKIGKITRTAVDKTANRVEITRIHSRINALKSSIETQKLKIGEHYWSKQAKDESYDPEAAEFFKAINNFQNQIELFETEIRAILDRETMAQADLETAGPLCPSCGAQNIPDGKFCAGCGTSLENAVISPGAGACASCGSAMLPDALFCGVCGTKK
jgi:ribosomal protein L32